MSSLFCVDQSDWELLRLTGADRARFLHGMCTADIEGLAVGQAVRACMLSVKGRVQAVIEVVRRETDLLLVCEPGCGEHVRELLERHAIVDDVSVAPESGAVHRMWGAPTDVWGAAPQFGPCPGAAANPDLVEAFRIAAGLPRYGIDVTESDFPFESRLVETLNYDKGCFLGQEPIARVRAQGTPRRAQRVLRLEAGGPVPPGTPVHAPAGDVAGEAAAESCETELGTVTSSAVIPGGAEVLALAMLRRAAAEEGTAVRVGERSATVHIAPLALALPSGA